MHFRQGLFVGLLAMTSGVGFDNLSLTSIEQGYTG